MSYLLSTTNSPQEKHRDIMHWLLAILEVVNAGGRLAPQKAIQKQLQELVDTYGSDAVWQGIKQFSMIFSIANASGVEVLFHSHPDLPSLLKTEEAAQRALSRWFEENSAIVRQAHQLFYGLVKLVPPSTTNKFAKGEATPEQREILGKVSQILEKENNDEESDNLCASL